jgi:crotonobetainyl-CoA:carnitine CoA-transferase CaiB-like acyl-CoA transferase
LTGEKTPAEIRRAPPTLGGDSDSILAEMGYSLEQIMALREEGVI